MNTVTYSSSDSSSPDGRLTSSSSSPAFLLRDDIVKGFTRFQLDKMGVSEGHKELNLVIERWDNSASGKRGKERGTDGRLRGRGQLGGGRGQLVWRAWS